MKKFREPKALATFYARDGFAFKKIFRMVRFTFFCFFLGLIQVMALDSYSQQTRISLNQQDQRLEEVLKTIEDKSEFFFLYNKDLINVEQTVNISVTDQTITTILDKLLKETDINYAVVNRQIILSNLEGFSGLSTQQVKSISGRITDVAGSPLPGVTVVIKGTTQGTITDGNGNYSLAGVSNDGTLVFSFVGMKSQEIPVAGKSTLDVNMLEESYGIDEVVAVGYGVQKRINMTGSVASVKGEELKTINVANVSNAIGGQVSGVVTRQISGEPGFDDAQILLRGARPLVLVDGIEREWNKLNMNDIESVTVLKDATAVAPFGLKGANGVILVTTKRGKTGKVTLTYTSEYGWQKPTNTADFMSAADGLSLRNQALIMDGKPDAVIGDDVLAQHRIGTDANPNTDWVKNYLKTSNNLKQNVTISGGSETARAFVSLGYLNQGNMLSEKSGYARYNVSSNLDLKVTKTTEISVDINIITDKNETSYGLAENEMLDLYRLRATEPDIFSNGLPAYQTSIGHSMDRKVRGDSENVMKKDYQNLGLSINQELPFIKGLSVKANLNYDKVSSNGKRWSLPYISYTYDLATAEYIEKNNWLTSKPSLSQTLTNKTFYTAQGYINYDNQFGKHGLQALAVYERRWGGQMELGASRREYDVTIPELDMGSPAKTNQFNNGTSDESGQDGVIVRGSYNFNQKYLFEVAGRYDRSSRYSPDTRSAFFPSVSVGWRVSEEGFIKNNIPAINNLKFRASYGKTGNPVGEEFAYLSKFLVNNAYVYGRDPIQEQGAYEGSERNILLTWETVLKANLGFDLTMWNGLFGMEFDVYRDYRSDRILAPDAIVPIEYGIGLSDENAGKEERYGFDLSLRNHTKITSDFSITNNFVFGFSRNKQIEIREAPGTYNIPQFRETGLPSNQIRGYRSAGLFVDQEDIDNWAYQGVVLPGDVKYVDLNGDGKINADDSEIIGRGRVPEIMFGYNLGLKFKRLDVSAFIQGTGNSDFYMGWGSENHNQGERGVRYPFTNDKPLEAHSASWTTDNPDPNAAYPRLSASQRNHNYSQSDYWVRNSSYARLKSVEMGYNFDPSLTSKFFMQNVRAYLNFYNVWTIYSKMPKDFDPENQTYNTYPQQFITSVGLNITF